jgi:hypothetical protein
MEACADGVHFNMADYKTMVYRNILDVGSMGEHVHLQAKWADGTIKNVSDIGPDEDIVDAVLEFYGTKNPGQAVGMSFTKTYSSGKFSKTMADGECIGTVGGSEPTCGQAITDTTEFEAGYDGAFLGGADSQGNPFTEKARGTAGDPILDISEVKKVKITIRPAACNLHDRPGVNCNADGACDPPASCTGANTNHRVDCWTNAPADCPWFWKSTWMLGGVNWAGSEKVQGTTISRLPMFNCEPGYCYFIDVHFDLGGTTEGSRTVLGNPENDKDSPGTWGVGKGVFFIYDPTVNTVANPSASGVLISGATRSASRSEIVQLVLIIGACLRLVDKLP